MTDEEKKAQTTAKPKKAQHKKQPTKAKPKTTNNTPINFLILLFLH